MRKITGTQISTFMLLLGLITSAALGFTTLITSQALLGEFYSVAFTVLLLLSFYGFAFLIYRLSHHFMPLIEGELPADSPQEFAYQVDTLFRLLLFYPLIRTYFIPTPIMRLVYQALGAKLGTNSYSGGAILDPALTHLGSNTLIGHDAVLFSHEIEGQHMALARIRIGNNVTVGAKATIMPGVTIEDNAIISVGAVVLKGTYIKVGECWGGVPAKKISSSKG
jgi:acetyltransferase-like isoleucine patch superfamily enzyme